MATVADIQAYIRANKVPKDVGMRMLSKAEDLDELKQQEYQAALQDPAEKSIGFTDTFAPISMAKAALPKISQLMSSQGRSDMMHEVDKLGEDKYKEYENASPGGKAMMVIQPTLDMLKAPIDSISEPLGRVLGGDLGSIGGVVGGLANLGLPKLGKSLRGVASASARGLGEGLMDSRATTAAGMGRSGIVGAGKGLLNELKGGNSPNLRASVSEQINSLPKMNPPVEYATEIPDFIKKISEDIHRGPSTFDDQLKSIPKSKPFEAAKPIKHNVIKASESLEAEKPASIEDQLQSLPKLNPPQEYAPEIPDFIRKIGSEMANEDPTKSNTSAAHEINDTLESIKAPEFDNPAQRALNMAQRRLKASTDPKDIADIQGRIEKLKGMVERLRQHKEMEIF